MKLILDKFGRVLIPKKIRQQLGIMVGDTLTIRIDQLSNELVLQAPTRPSPDLILTKEGFPVLSFQEKSTIGFNPVELIKKTREERSEKIIGELKAKSYDLTSPKTLNEPSGSYKPKPEPS